MRGFLKKCRITDHSLTGPFSPYRIIECHYGAEQIGTLQMEFYSTYIKTACILAVDVLPEFRRRGVATALYRRAKHRAVLAGIQIVTANAVGSGTVQLHEKTFGPGATTYYHGDQVTYEEAIRIMDVEFGQLILQSKLDLGVITDAFS